MVINAGRATRAASFGDICFGQRYRETWRALGQRISSSCRYDLVGRSCISDCCIRNGTNRCGRRIPVAIGAIFGAGRHSAFRTRAILQFSSHLGDRRKSRWSSPRNQPTCFARTRRMAPWRGAHRAQDPRHRPGVAWPNNHPPCVAGKAWRGR